MRDIGCFTAPPLVESSFWETKLSTNEFSNFDTSIPLYLSTILKWAFQRKRGGGAQDFVGLFWRLSIHPDLGTRELLHGWTPCHWLGGPRLYLEVSNIHPPYRASLVRTYLFAAQHHLAERSPLLDDLQNPFGPSLGSFGDNWSTHQAMWSHAAHIRPS